jgi:integrase
MGSADGWTGGGDYPASADLYSLPETVHPWPLGWGTQRIKQLHDLRHSFLSWLIQSGQDIKTIQAVAGHSQIQVTLDVYGHLMPGAMRGAADKVQGMFGQE